MYKYLEFLTETNKQRKEKRNVKKKNHKGIVKSEIGNIHLYVFCE